MKKLLKVKKHVLNFNKKNRFVLPIILFAGIGSALLLLTRAAVPNIAFQSESATRSGSAQLVSNDSSASGGSYVLFKESGGGGGGNGVGGSGADMTPGRKCAAGTTGASTINDGGSLQGAIDSLPNGGTLVVNAGTYDGVYISGRSNITICGAPGSRPIVRAQGRDGFYVGDNSSYVHIEGFEIIGVMDESSRGIIVWGGAHHIAAWDNWIHDLGSTGIGGAFYCGYIDFRYNRIWNTAWYNYSHTSAITIWDPENCAGNNPDFGIYTDSIIGNVGWNNGEKIGGATDGNCIIWDDTLGTQRGIGEYRGRVLIANNLCVANGGRGIHVFSSSRADVVNNTNYHDFAPGFQINADAYSGQTDASYSNDVRFINNVSIGREGFNGFDVAASSNIVKSNNIFYPVTRDDTGGGGYQILANPGFINPTYDPNSWDFRPNSGSPLINGGIGSYSDIIIPNVDITGKSRSSSSPSIGAYEP